jgi:hypothetical protein
MPGRRRRSARVLAWKPKTVVNTHRMLHRALGGPRRTGLGKTERRQRRAPATSRAQKPQSLDRGAAPGAAMEACAHAAAGNSRQCRQALDDAGNALARIAAGLSRGGQRADCDPAGMRMRVRAG